MQEQPLQPDLLAQPLVRGGIAVLVVTRHREADAGRARGSGGAAGFDADFAITLATRRSSTRKWLIEGLLAGLTCTWRSPPWRRPTCSGASTLMTPSACGRPAAPDSAFDAGSMIFAQQSLQFGQGALLASTIRPDVSRSSRCTNSRLSRGRSAQGFDDPERDAAAAVAGDARRLVDRQQAGILEHDGLVQRRQQTFRRRTVAILRRFDANRRDLTSSPASSLRSALAVRR